MKIPNKILFALAEPLAIVPRPYAAVADRLGMPERELLSRIRKYKKAGVVRRVGTVLGHFMVGYKCNALVLWKVDEHDLETVGRIFASFPAVTHCYARRSYQEWPYNLYTMVHARNKRESQAVIKAMSDKADVKEYKVQSTLKELKKIKSDLRGILS